MKCTNCGKIGHTHRYCREPVISYGIIALKANNKETALIINDHLKNIDIITPSVIKNLNSDKEINEFAELKNNISFLMVMRKHTYGYIAFVSGDYNISNYTYISFLFNQMVQSEIQKIATNTFDFIWSDVWGKKSENNEARRRSEDKYRQLINGRITLKDLIRTAVPKYDCPDWGIPKGRRMGTETDLECAQREFYEETGYSSNDYILLNNIAPYIENIIGNNGIKYRYVYYVALLTSQNKPFYNKPDGYMNYEVGDIGFFSFDTSIQKIRDDFPDRRKLIYSLFSSLVNAIIK